MKKILLIIGLCVSIGLSAQTKKFSEIVTDGDTITSAASTDFIYVIEDPLGTPASKAIRASAFLQSDNLSPAASDLWFTSDTIVLGSFSKDTTRTTDFYGSFYNDGSDTLVVTSMTAVLQGSSPSVAVDVQWHATFNSGSAVHLNTSAPTITSTTTGDSDTTFDNAQIPPGVWVWMETPTVTTPATYISVSLSGYRLNRAY